MRRRVITVQRDQTVERAQTLMAVNNIRHLPVLEGERLVGVLSDRDVRGVMIPQRPLCTSRGRNGVFFLPPSVRVEEAMSAEPVWVTPGADIEDAARTMLSRKIGCLPVVDGGRVVGIITGSDILWVFTEIMGILESSSRLDVALGREPRALERATEIISAHRGRLISVGMSPGSRGARRVCHFRLRSGSNLATISDALRRAGYRVLDRMG